MRIAEAGHALGISTATLRLWERQGLIHPGRTPGGSRRYTEEDLALVRRIQYLRRVEHLSLSAIGRVLGEGPGLPSSGDLTDEAPQLGDRLRAKRRRAGLTLRQVAEKTGLSVSFLSAAERGTTGLSIATLRKLTTLYGVTVSALLDTRRAPMRLVRAVERRRLPDSGSGVRIEQLALGTRQMDPEIFIVDPGAGSDGAYDHAGEEFIFVLRGALEIWLDEQEHYLLGSGDCLYFPSTMPHRWHNPGPQAAELLWVNTPPTF